MDKKIVCLFTFHQKGIFFQTRMIMSNYSESVSVQNLGKEGKKEEVVEHR